MGDMTYNSAESNPLVSIIIPVYNGTNYLRESIDSALAQTYSNYEVLVIDDGSTDGTWDLIQTYGERIRGIKKENGGTASALNAGILQSRGKYVSWLSHDDKYFSQKIERQVAYLQSHPEYRACYSDYLVIDENGKLLAKVQAPWYERNQLVVKFLTGNLINGIAILIERACFDDIGMFDAKWKYTQDYDMWLRYLRRYEMGKVDEVLVMTRSHSNRGTVIFNAIQMKETQDCCRNALNHWAIQEVFRELGPTPTQKEISDAYITLADNILKRQNWFALANEIYSRAVAAYPSWKNPARWRSLMCIPIKWQRSLKSILRPYYWKWIKGL
jgi:glycosyltransferase involved in cell wall biosynthesis